MLESTDKLLNDLYDLDPKLARKIEAAIADEREAGYQEGWSGHSHWIGL